MTREKFNMFVSGFCAATFMCIVAKVNPLMSITLLFFGVINFMLGLTK